MDRTDEVMARKANRFRAGITSLEELRRGIKRQGPFRSRLRSAPAGSAPAPAGSASGDRLSLFDAVRNGFGFPMLCGAARDPDTRAEAVAGAVVGGDGIEPPTSTV